MDEAAEVRLNSPLFLSYVMKQTCPKPFNLKEATMRLTLITFTSLCLVMSASLVMAKEKKQQNRWTRRP